MSLVQRIHVSSSNCKINEGDLRQILESALRHNLANDVTGMLLYSSGHFLQVLEGEETTLNNVLFRISLDTRHRNIIEIARATVRSRDFRAWSMGFRGVTADDAKKLPGYTPFFAHDCHPETIGVTPGLAFDILKKFAEAVE